MGRFRPLAVLSFSAVVWLPVRPAGPRRRGARRSRASPPAASRSRPSDSASSCSSASGTRWTPSAIADSLPATYKPVVRYPLFYGKTGRDLGLEYQFRLPASSGATALAGQLFAYLRSARTPGPITAFQEAYNEQGNGVPGQRRPIREVRGPILHRRGQGGEVARRSRSGCGRPRLHASYFINWYGRSDFQFHVYTKTDGARSRHGLQLRRAAGDAARWSPGEAPTAGTGSTTSRPGRSRGAGATTSTTPDLDGDGSADYRIPPVWEYDARRLPRRPSG